MTSQNQVPKHRPNYSVSLEHSSYPPPPLPPYITDQSDQVCLLTLPVKLIHPRLCASIHVYRTWTAALGLEVVYQLCVDEG